MNGRLFSQAMCEVDDRYYEEAAGYRRRRYRWVKFASLAACAAVVLAVSSASLQRHPGQTPPEDDPPAVTQGDSQGDAAGQAVTVHINESGAPSAVTGNICLGGDDYAPMTYEALLAYFDVSLPISETLPGFARQSGGFGVYATEDRGVYYDGNSILFASADGTRRVCVGLAKVWKHTYDLLDLTGDTLAFTEINGRDLALFHYTAEDGADCYYAEFLQNDVAFLVGSENLSLGEYVKCLEALVEQGQGDAGDTRTITGTITAVDPYANHLGILLCGDGAPPYSRGYGIELPEGYSAGDWALGDLAEVTYRGEPATICTIWAEQIVEIRPLS